MLTVLPAFDRSTADATNLISQLKYDGYTPLADSMQTKVLEPIVFNQAASGQLAKPVLIITITDGKAMDFAGFSASIVAWHLAC